MAPFTVEALEKLDGLDPVWKKKPPTRDDPEKNADAGRRTRRRRTRRNSSTASSASSCTRRTAFAVRALLRVHPRALVSSGIAVDLGDEPNAGSPARVRRPTRRAVRRRQPGGGRVRGTYQVDASTLRAVDGEEEDEPLPRAGRKRFDRPNSAYMLFYERVERANERTSAEGAAARAGPGVGDSETLSHPARARLPPSIAAMPAPVRRARMAKNLRFAFESNAAPTRSLRFADALVRALVEPLGKSEKSDVFARTPPRSPARSPATAGGARRPAPGRAAPRKPRACARRTRPAAAGARDAFRTKPFGRNRRRRPDGYARRELASTRRVVARRSRGARDAGRAIRLGVFVPRAPEQRSRRTSAPRLRRRVAPPTARRRGGAGARLAPRAVVGAALVARASAFDRGVLGAPGVSAEAREAFASVLAAAVANLYD